MNKYAITEPKLGKNQKIYGADYKVYDVHPGYWEVEKTHYSSVAVTGVTDYSNKEKYKELEDYLTVTKGVTGANGVTVWSGDTTVRLFPSVADAIQYKVAALAAVTQEAQKDLDNSNRAFKKTQERITKSEVQIVDKHPEFFL